TGSGFTADHDFNWNEFDKPPDKRVVVQLEHLQQVFEHEPERELKDAAHALATVAGINERSAYNALSPSGKFATYLRRDRGMISFRLDGGHSSKSPGKLDE